MKTEIQIISPRYILLTFMAFLLASNLSFASETESSAEDVAFEIYCPPTKWLDCTDEIWNLGWLGNAWYKDYTGTHDAGWPTVDYHLNDCNIGYITRTWKIADYSGYWHTCTQTIYVNGNYFNSGSIQWPDNVELTGCYPDIEPEHMPYGAGMPTWSTYGATCSKIGYSYHDNKYVYGPGCYEIIRTWKIVDCCNFNPWTNTGIWTYNQRITVTTAYDEPEVWVPYDVTAETSNCEKAWVDVPELEVKDGCYDQYLITNNSPYAWQNGADASGKYPVGTTKVRFMVKYNCWQTKFYYVNIVVQDKSTPVPYCYYGLAVPLMGIDTDDDGEVDDGMREVWASELDAGSYYPCNTYYPLRFSFSSDPDDNVRVYSCEDVGEQEVNIWVTAHDGRQDYCTTYIKLQNNAANIPNCDPLEEAMISGKISSVYGNTESLTLDVNSSWEGMIFDTSYVTETDVFVIDSTVLADGTVTYDYGINEVNVPLVDTTDIDKDFDIAVTEGEYTLENLDLNEDYILTLYNADSNTDYIDAMDVLLFSAYLEGKVELNMYQKMAADLNHDNMVNEADLAILQSHVEGTSPVEFEWVTLDPDFEMPTNLATDIDDYPTSKLVEINNRNAIGVDLMIFQMGDLTHETSVEDLLGTKAVTLRDENSFEFTGVSPNPFSNETSFTFINDKTQVVTLEIFALNGSSLYRSSQELGSGSQTILIENDIISASGVYLYKLTSTETAHQGKLIKVD